MHHALDITTSRLSAIHRRFAAQRRLTIHRKGRSCGWSKKQNEK